MHYIFHNTFYTLHPISTPWSLTQMPFSPPSTPFRRKNCLLPWIPVTIMGIWLKTTGCASSLWLSSRYWTPLTGRKASYRRDSLRSDWPSFIMGSLFSESSALRTFHTLNCTNHRKNGTVIMMGWDAWWLESPQERLAAPCTICSPTGRSGLNAHQSSRCFLPCRHVSP